MNNHPWHDVPFGNELENSVNAIIEIPRGSKAKYEVDKDSGFLRLDRVLNTAFYYPVNYGFIPQTFAGDNDPLDILVLSQIDFVPMSIVRAQVIGVMRMYDKGEDDKIIAVCADDSSVNHITKMEDLPPHFVIELRHFFLRYKELEPKSAVEIDEFMGKDKALEIIREAVVGYQRDILPTIKN